MSGNKYEWLTYEEAAKYLGVTERQLRRWTQSGRVESVRMGSRALFSTDALDAFVAASTVGGAA